MKHVGDLDVTVDSLSYAQTVSEITGCLRVYAENTSLPALTSVAEYMCVNAENTSMPALTSVGGILYVKAGVKFDHGRIKFGCGQVLTISEYALHIGADGLYRAGCRGPWKANEALDHWSEYHRNQVRAQAFSKAIRAHQESLAPA